MIRLYSHADETCRETVERYAQRHGKVDEATRYFDYLLTTGLSETDARWKACLDFDFIGEVRSKYNPAPFFPRAENFQ